MSTMKAFLRNERGEGRAGCLFWSLLLLILIMIAWKAVPVQLSVMELKDKMEEAAQLRSRDTARQIEKFILDRCIELELPVTAKNIDVKKGAGRIQMKVDFTVPLDFFVYTHDWDINIDMRRDIFQF